MARYRNEVERISVYIINLTNLYKLYWKKQEQVERYKPKLDKSDKTDVIGKIEKPDEIDKTDKTDGTLIELSDGLKLTKEQLEYLADSRLNLERFILNFPTTYKISLKAAIALAEWLLEYEKICPANGDSLKDQLFRSFSYLTIYEERGAQVFNILRDNRKFRLFTAVERGKFLALLLAMYKPIKAIKEVCCFTMNHKSKLRNLVHYTSMECLKKILSEDQKKKEPRFRINNCGYMNDVFEGSVFLKSIALISGEIEKIDAPGHSALAKAYFPQLNRSHEDMLPSGSNVYIGSLSVKKDSFPMWSLYAANEKGCNIEFGDGFFDIDGDPCLPKALRGYLLSKYTDQDYPLYIVQYIGSEFVDEYNNYKKFKEENKITEVDFEILDTEGFTQECGTEGICHKDLFRFFEQIHERWNQLDSYLTGDMLADSVNDSKDVIRAFAADRINEIRFLFKNSDYEFEGEVRVIYTESTDASAAKTDASLNTPMVYVNVERDIKDLTIRLGSRIEDATVDRYVTWLKHTKKVQKVGLAKRNRYTT